MKHIDQLVKDKDISEDDGKRAKDEIDAKTKRHTDRIDEICGAKVKEVETI